MKYLELDKSFTFWSSGSVFLLHHRQMRINCNRPEISLHKLSWPQGDALLACMHTKTWYAVVVVVVIMAIYLPCFYAEGLCFDVIVLTKERLKMPKMLDFNNIPREDNHVNNVGLILILKSQMFMKWICIWNENEKKWKFCTKSVWF